MDTNSIILGIQILAIALFIGLPYLAWKLWHEYDAIGFTLFLVLFWMISSFVAGISIITWLDYFYLLIDKV